jgi:hypothetical protein
LQTYKKDMIDYKNKKFQLQKELESVYYGLAERTLKQTKTAEEEFLQRQDELKNSVSTFQCINFLYCFTKCMHTSLHCCTVFAFHLKYNSFSIPIDAIYPRAFCEAGHHVF